MKLSVNERMVLVNVLPSLDSGSRAMYRITEQMYRDLSFTSEEIEDWGIKFSGEEYVEPDGTKKTVEKGRFVWDQSKAESKDIELSDQGQKIIKKIFEKLDIAEKLQPAHIKIYDRFMEAENGDTD